MTAREFLKLMAFERQQKEKDEAVHDAAYDNLPNVPVVPIRLLKAPPSS
jgi:hypothetical protein